MGSGTGDLSYEISKIAKKVIGIEILKHKFNYSRNKFKNKNLQFIYGDATIFDFKKLGISKFDKVVLSNVLEHIDRRPEFLKSISRVSDIILLRVPLITRDWLAVYKKENGYYYKLDPTHFTEYTVEQVHDEAKKAGFRVKTYYTQFGEFYGVLEKNGKR